MNAIEQTRRTEEKLISVINESGLPITTIYYMLNDIQRQIIDALNQEQNTTAKNKESEE